MGHNETVGSLTGSGDIHNLEKPPATSTLTIGRDGTNATFSGALHASTFDFGGAFVAENSNALILVKVGAGRQDLTGTNNYTGQTIVNDGTLALSGNGTFAAGGSLNLLPGGTFVFDNSGTNNTARLVGYASTSSASLSVPTNFGVTLNGGTISLVGHNGAVSSQTVGTLTLAAGSSTVNVTDGSGAASAVLTFNNLSRSTGATVDFTGTLGASGNNPRVTFNNAQGSNAVESDYATGQRRRLCRLQFLKWNHGNGRRIERLRLCREQRRVDLKPL